MAKGVNKTKIDAMSPANLLEPEVVGGKERAIYDEYEAAALASGQYIELPDLPKGAMITDWIIDHDALGEGVTLALGNAASATALMAATNCATADKKNMTDDGVAAALGYRCDDVTSGAEKTKPRITIGGAAATGTIKVLIRFTAKA